MKTTFLFISSSALILLISCQAKQTEKDIFSNVSDTTSITGLTGDSVKLVKTGGIQCKVKDVYQSTRGVSQLVQHLNGLISHQNIESIENQTKELNISDDSIMVISAYTPNAEIIARIPAQHLEEFMYGVADLGYFIQSSKIDVDDKSLYYLANQLKQQNRNQILSSENDRKSKGLTSAQTIHVHDKSIEQEVTNKQIDVDVKYSTIQIHLFQNPLIRKETMANHTIDNHHLPFGKSLGNAFNAGLEYFLDFIIGLVHLWVFIITGIVGWITFKYYRYKRRTGLAKQ